MYKADSQSNSKLTPQVDLNLLRYLTVLVQECSVSRAAERVDITQPAMSAALKRLRTAFGDPILVRSGQAMVATPRAEEMAATVKPLLHSVDKLSRPALNFEPKLSRLDFTLMGSDYVQYAILGKLCQIIAIEAPGISILQRPANPNKVVTWMESGQVDLGIGYLPMPPENLHARPLFQDEQVCIVRKNHPALKHRLTTELYAELVHVAVSPGGAGLYGTRIDQVLSSHGIRRRIGLTLPSFLALPYVVSQTDYIATVPSRIAKHFAQKLELQIITSPIQLPAFEISMFWHERVHIDLANVWLRQKVVKASAFFSRS